jgi:signal transduction histidine kinase
MKTRARGAPAHTSSAHDQRLSIIFDVARALATQQDLETMLPAFLTSLTERLETADASVLMTYDPSDARLVVRAAQGYDLTKLEQVRLAPGEATCGTTFQTGEVQFYATPKDISAGRANLMPDNRELIEQATTDPRSPQSAVCIPLFTGQTKVGVLMLESRQLTDAFVREDLAFLEAVADLIALAIENAHLRSDLQATRALEEANRLKAELISTLAHEMRTPLTSIKGYSTALLMEDVSFDPESQAEFLRIIDEECDVLQDLIHDLLESSIIDAGLLKLEPQPVLLPRLAKNLVDDMAHRTEKHQFVVDFPKRFPIVDADPHRVEQVLRNLVDNAIKYSPEGGLVVVRGEARTDEVIISVADQGVGIAPEHLNRLFEKFFRVESGLGRHVVGSGLGLPIARTIVESHGGRIWAESQVGEGTTLCFTLPLEGPSQEAEDEPQTRAEGEAQ